MNTALEIVSSLICIACIVNMDARIRRLRKELKKSEETRLALLEGHTESADAEVEEQFSERRR